MDDREKVIKGLECCMSEKICNSPCPYKGQCDDGGYYFSKAIEDAIGLLKAQEPQTVIVDDIPKDDSWFGIWFGRCPNCKEMLTKKYHKHFCGNCGQGVKWSG